MRGEKGFTMPEPETFRTNLIRRNLRNRDLDLNPFVAEQVGELPSTFEADVNRKLDQLQERLHTLKK